MQIILLVIYTFINFATAEDIKTTTKFSEIDIQKRCTTKSQEKK